MVVREWSIGDDFIGIFETSYDCQRMIDWWRWHHESNSTFHRIGFGKKRPDGGLRDDEVCRTVSQRPFNTDDNFQKEYNLVIGECLALYRDNFSTVKDRKFQQTRLNVQRTIPGGGYHKWHCENRGGPTGDRVLATMMYLNTVPPEHGGETEFLYQHKRFNPISGHVLIWPAGFTHTHRGNAPLKGEKFIATSWKFKFPCFKGDPIALLHESTSNANTLYSSWRLYAVLLCGERQLI